MYERRIDTADLPFFLGLLDHLAAKGCPVPRTIHDRSGAAFRMIDGKAVALIEFLPGVSVDQPSPAQAHAVGEALAGMHLAAPISHERANAMALPPGALLAACGKEALASIDPALARAGRQSCPRSARTGRRACRASVIHADLFPDNVLMLGDEVTGLIDFYFACTDITAYDLAVTHAAWCFCRRRGSADISAALLAGYEAPAAEAAERRPCRCWRAARHALSREPRLRLAEHAGRCAGHAQGPDGLRPPAEFYATARRGLSPAPRLPEAWRHEAGRDLHRWRLQGQSRPRRLGRAAAHGRHEKELSGGEAHTTNNRMEMTAVIRALNALIEPCEVVSTPTAAM
jgi:homoserine kinase